MSDINKHPVLRKLYEVALSLERLPSSPEQTTTAILLSDAASDVNSLVDEVRRTAHVGVMANFTFMAAEELRAAIEPFRCDTFGCETPESQRLDKACSALDRVHTKGLLKAAQEYRAFLDSTPPSPDATIDNLVCLVRDLVRDLPDDDAKRRKAYGALNRWGLTPSPCRAGETTTSDAAIVERCAQIVEEPSGYWTIGSQRQPYWDGVEKAKAIRALATPPAERGGEKG